VGLAITVSIFSVHSPKKMEDFIDADVVAWNAVFSQIVNGAIKPLCILAYAGIIRLLAF